MTYICVKRELELLYEFHGLLYLSPILGWNVMSYYNDKWNVMSYYHDIRASRRLYKFHGLLYLLPPINRSCLLSSPRSNLVQRMEGLFIDLFS